MAQVIISIEYTDIEGQKKSIPYYHDTAQISTLALAQTQATALVAALQPISGADITRATVQFELTTVTPPGALDWSRVDAGSTATFLQTNGKKYSYYLPAIFNGLIANKALLIGNANVADMGTLIASSGVRSDQGLDLTQLVGGKQTTRK